ncbi:hypothetical protein MMC29_000285 [Sticta canariensis]|nr:hypothetical protein [Sticta canariensis]
MAGLPQLGNKIAIALFTEAAYAASGSHTPALMADSDERALSNSLPNRAKKELDLLSPRTGKGL